MINTNMSLTDTHKNWQQRVKRELGARKLYVTKAYYPGARELADTPNDIWKHNKSSKDFGNSSSRKKLSQKFGNGKRQSTSNYD